MPFARYKDFADCKRKNVDKGDPNAYCGSIKREVENKARMISNCDDVLALFGVGKNGSAGASGIKHQGVSGRPSGPYGKPGGPKRSVGAPGIPSPKPSTPKEDKLSSFGRGKPKTPKPLQRPGFQQYKPKAPSQPKVQPGISPHESPGGGQSGPATWDHKPWNFQRTYKALDGIISALDKHRDAARSAVTTS